MENEIYNTIPNLSIQQLGYQYEFDIQIISIKIDYKSQFNFKILIKRGNKQNEIERIFKYNPYLENEIPINEEFSIVSVLNPLENSNFDFLKNRVFHDKVYKIYICIYTKTGFKPAISGEINLSKHIENSHEEILTLSNKTFNEVIIKYKINSNYISEYDPLSVNGKSEIDLTEASELSNINYSTFKNQNESRKIEELLEKKYVNTLSTNRFNNIFNNILKIDSNIEKNPNENNNKSIEQNIKFFKLEKSDEIGNKLNNNKNLNNNTYLTEVDNTYITNFSKMDELQSNLNNLNLSLY